MKQARPNGPTGWRVGSRSSANHWRLSVARSSRPKQAQVPSRLRSVLVPLDGTPTAEHALPYALNLARRAGAEVTLAHVYPAPRAAHQPELLGWHAGEYLVEPCRDYLESLTRKLAELSPVRVRPLLLRGYWPEDALCETGDVYADLVVMATRPRGWWSRLWSGSVSTGVIRNLRTPVLLVPGRDTPPELAHEPQLGRVLVPLDGSDRAERALGPAVALATLSNGTCELLCTVRSWPHAVDWSLAHGVPAAPVEREWEARRYLRGVTERLEAVAVPTRWRVLTGEWPAAGAIVRYAQRSGTEVIAPASRGRGAVSQLFCGSVAEEVARRAGMPVLMTRAHATEV